MSEDMAEQAAQGREAEIRERAAKATPGPWIGSPKKDGISSGQLADGTSLPGDRPAMVRWQRMVGGERHTSFVATCEGSGCNNDADADFIANAPADIAWLLEQLDAERGRAAELRELLVHATQTVEQSGVLHKHPPSDNGWYKRARALLLDGAADARPGSSGSAGEESEAQ